MTSDLVMVGYYDYRLVTLSVLISILGAYAARDLSERVRDSRGRAWLIWLVCGATADGIGTWSMHYVNEAAIHHYGYAREEFLSMTITAVCLLDSNLPNVDGLEVLRKIRPDERTRPPSSSWSLRLWS